MDPIAAIAMTVLTVSDFLDATLLNLELLYDEPPPQLVDSPHYLLVCPLPEF